MKKFLILLFLIICFALSVFSQCKDVNCGLVVRGKVTDLEVERSEKRYVKFFATINAEFINEGTENVILFKPEFSDGYWLGGRSLSVTETGESVFGYGLWQSVSGADSYRKLAEKLDIKTPPKDLTIILKPNEKWNLLSKTDIFFSAKEETIISNSISKERSWKEMQEFPSKLWLSVSYEILPWNVEYFKPNLIKKLQKRWKNYGNVLIDDEEEKESHNHFNHFIISSEPMLIDFSQAKEKQTEAVK